MIDIKAEGLRVSRGDTFTLHGLNGGPKSVCQDGSGSLYPPNTGLGTRAVTLATSSSSLLRTSS